MYGMGSEGTGWILTLVVLAVVVLVGGLYILIGHLISEVARVRIGYHASVKAQADAQRAQVQDR